MYERVEGSWQVAVGLGNSSRPALLTIAQKYLSAAGLAVVVVAIIQAQAA